MSRRRGAPPTAAMTGRCAAGLWLLTGASSRGIEDRYGVTKVTNIPFFWYIILHALNSVIIKYLRQDPAEGPWRCLAVGAAKWPVATRAATHPNALQRVPPQDP
eukprot:6199083-Pleurochrysis_carterae.AAC.1